MIDCLEAEISIKRLEVQAQQLNPDGKQTLVRIGGRGSVVRSLKDFIELRSRFDGVWSSSFDLGSFEGQMVTEGAQRAFGNDAPPSNGR